jgi:exopolysaccharide production protein ExoZ
VKLWSLQALRFFAALAVVHLHSVIEAADAGWGTGSVGRFGLIFGRAGVDVFFVISGVIIALTSRGLTASDFIGKRLRRILPIYLLLTVPWLILNYLAGSISWRGLLATFALWPVTDRLTGPLMPVAWTLCFEMLFYACAALTIWRPRMFVVVLMAYAAALVTRTGPLLQFIGNPIILEFLFGVSLAHLPKWRPAALAIPLGLAIVVLGAILGWPPYGSQLEFLRGDQAWVRIATLGLPAALIVWGALQIDCRPGLLTYLGDASYSLYLIHPLVLIGIGGVLRWSPYRLPADLTIAAEMLLCVLAAWRIHEAVEKPVLAFLGRLRPSIQATA